MDPKQIAARLLSDPPFSYPHPDDRTRSLLVETSALRLYKQELGVRVRTAMQNSGITAVVGRARSGKTHFILNLDYSTNVQRVWRGAVIYLPLQGEDLTFRELVQMIANDRNLQRLATEVGFSLSASSDCKEIKSLVEALRGRYGSNCGIILAVDNLDEHFRQREARAQKQGIAPVEDLQRFLGLFRLLIGESGIDKGLCVLLSLTQDARAKLERFLSDPTLRGRFDLIYDPTNPGQILELTGLSEDEATLLVSDYMHHWAARNEFELPTFEECVSNGKNTFPYSVKAVQLLWRADPYAGLVCLGCRNLLFRKFNDIQPQAVEDLILTEADMAYAISASAGMFGTFEQVKPEIDALIGGPEIEKEIRAWIKSVASTRYAGDLRKANFPAAFSAYLERAAKDAGIVLRVNRNVTVIDRLSNKPAELDLRAQLEGVQIGLSFVRDARVEREEGRVMASALRNRQIASGIFVYPGKRPEIGFDGQRRQGVSVDLYGDLQDIASGLDFNSVVAVVHVDELSAWGLIWCRELGEESKRGKGYAFVENRLRFLRKLEEMKSAEPRRMPDYGSTAGDTLDRGGA